MFEKSNPERRHRFLLYFVFHRWQDALMIMTVAKRCHATWGLTPAVFRLVPVRLKWLYWAIFDPAFPQCLHYLYSGHVRSLE